jgi:hypothetical protein
MTHFTAPMRRDGAFYGTRARPRAARSAQGDTDDGDLLIGEVRVRVRMTVMIARRMRAIQDDDEIASTDKTQVTFIIKKK